MNEKNGTSKNILGKLKRLMTVTEKDVIEENEKEKRRLKEAVPVVDKKGKLSNKATQEINEPEEKPKKPFLKIVDSDPHFTNEDTTDDTTTEEESTQQNEDDVELMGNIERDVQHRAKEKAKEKDKKGADTKKSKGSFDEYDEDEEDESEYTLDEEDKNLYNFDNTDFSDKEFERRPRKKKKSFFKSLFKIGQALNAKPDEFVSDENLANPQVLKNNVTAKSKANSNKSESITNDKLNSDNQSHNINQQTTNDVDSNINQKTESNPILDMDMSFVTVQKVNGNIFIEGNIEPMYTIENNSATFNVEIGKLSPILLNAYEAYLQPEVLEAKKAEQAKKQAEVMEEEIITQATTAFNSNNTDELKRDNPFDEDINSAKENEKSVDVVETLTEKINENQLERNKRKAEEKRKALEKKKQELEKAKEKKTVKEKLFSQYSVAVDYSAIASNEDKAQTIEDYESPQDAGAVMAELNLNIRKLFFRILIVGIVFVIQFALVILQRFFPELLIGFIPNAEMMFCVTTLVMLSVAVGVSGMTVKNGLIPLIGFKGNSDTAVAVASVAAIMQSIVSLFDCNAFYNGTRSLYAILVMFALGLNLLGKMTMVLRIKDNFRFVAQDRRKYAATILNDKKNAEKMVRGTNAADPIVGYQRKTYFYKNFLKLSYAPDPSETTAGKFSIISLVIAVTVSIIHGIMFKNLIGAFSAFAMVACLSVPVSCLLAVNIPMKKLCRKALNNDAMIVGYTAVTQFVDTSAIMIDSKEIYPYSSVELVSLKPYVTSNLENYMLNVAAVLKVANTSLTYVFADVIERKGDSLPYVDSVKFEENKGIVGWIGGERVLIGRRELMEKYGVELPPIDDETTFIEERRNITYLASAGQLVAMIVTAYKADDKTKTEIKKLESEGVSILVRTADPNLTVESIASDYGLHIRSVKILPNSLGNICKEAISEKSRRARCYIGTRGKLSSLASAITGCIRMKSCINVAVIIQIIGIVLGVLFTSAVALTSAEQGINTLELLGFMAFWSLTTIVSTYVRKP